MPAAGPQGNHRKTLAVKHQDGEPLTRVDLQYDLLYYLFTDSQTVFTDPHTTLHGDPAGSKVTFRDLYVNTLLHSPRCSKVSRDKLQDNPEFADEFAKIALLSNVGRINTTMAFFPEMRTALRTYHPVPSLQKTDGNLQDAPRIKNILKSCLLATELQNTPTNPAEVLTRSRSGVVPPTTIVNLIFILASHASLIAQTHFPPNSGLDLLDFFSPVHISSESRARAFLWLCFHYYEATSPNPFEDPQSQQKPGRIPPLESLSPEEAQLENVDTPEELAWGEKMQAQRKIFVENKDKLDESMPTDEALPVEGNGNKRGRGKGARARRGKAQPARAPSHASPQAPTRGTSSSESRLSSGHAYDGNGTPEELPKSAYHRYSPEPYRLPPIHTLSTAALPAEHAYPPPPYRPSDTYYARGEYGTLDGGPARNYPRTPRRESLPPLRYIAAYDEPSPPRELPPLALPPAYPHHVHARRAHTPPRLVDPPRRLPDYPPTPQPGTRSMLEQAWHVVMTSDPLEESDDEMDENTRLDLLLRLKIINRLRGKEPTPERELGPPH